MNFYYSTKMPLKISLLCIIKLNRRWAKKDRKRFRVQNHVRIIQLLQSVIFLFCFIICRRLMDFNSMFTFDIFQFYCVSFCYYHIFAHDQIETPTANILYDATELTFIMINFMNFPMIKFTHSHFKILVFFPRFFNFIH